ncbi:bestrophin family protein [Mucilaginibacter myungsuensis]|uniref:Multidrug transporter n=1 Tax=Mucilaginibacter myungsuensis TaxID=649104 RepID=A0A929PYR3_9SPHI|nr:bestrophin family ion channel [Mucilaginibacter myungsuensis]MBE9663725.1 multidrug transporter [Mucilaginibacter myungsuensis]MDN3598951.1 bestrophin family ion channel [Mucilaginibacter myungsuensis]
MNTGKYYSLSHFIPWSRRFIYFMLIVSSIPCLLYYFLDFTWVAIPWVPIALVGTAAAFITGFRNTQTYNRAWESRQIWGGIVNSSRTWGVMVTSFVRQDPTTEGALHKQMIYRHIAWLTALRFQMRESRPWENVKNKAIYIEYRQYYKIPEWESDMAIELSPLLADDELKNILSKSNKATQLIKLQSAELRKLNEEGHLVDYNYVEMERVLKDLYDLQGRSERIKNYPYPRQFVSVSFYFIYLLALLLPLGFLSEFSKMGKGHIWLTIPCSVIVGWMFLVLESIGEATENPFEGNANDTPITSMSRTIEIDLREMLNEQDIPPPLTAVNNILM